MSYLYDVTATKGASGMLSVRVPTEIEERLARLAELTGRSKSFYAREALVAHMDDLEDIYLGEQRLEAVRAGKDAVRPLADLAAEYGL